MSPSSAWSRQSRSATCPTIWVYFARTSASAAWAFETFVWSFDWSALIPLSSAWVSARMPRRFASDAWSALICCRCAAIFAWSAFCAFRASDSGSPARAGAVNEVPNRRGTRSSAARMARRGWWCPIRRIASSCRHRLRTASHPGRVPVPARRWGEPAGDPYTLTAMPENKLGTGCASEHRRHACRGPVRNSRAARSADDHPRRHRSDRRCRPRSGIAGLDPDCHADTGTLHRARGQVGCGSMGHLSPPVGL